MSDAATGFWHRAKKALKTASMLIEEDPDAAVSRTYYGAFYAASAYFASEGRLFSKHSAVESAVHRDLVRNGKAEPLLGKYFTALHGLRWKADYQFEPQVLREEAVEAVDMAKAFVKAIGELASFE